MPVLTIRHITTYCYRQPVGFGEHRMMFRPRDAHDQRLIEAKLDITPRPASLRFAHDVFGNHVGIARFEGRAEELRFDSTIRLDHAPEPAAELELDDHASTLPFCYTAEEVPDLARYIERHHADPDNQVDRWARQYLRQDRPTGTLELLCALNEAIHAGCTYLRRDEKGIQEPVQTLKLGRGSCRDFALLMIEAARSLGLAARFVSGYLAVPTDDADETSEGSTHAWMQVYLPGAGWIDFDPTSGSIGKGNLVAVAVVREPAQAVPLHGTWFGFPSDALGMTVEVIIGREEMTGDAGADESPGFSDLNSSAGF